MESYLYLPFLEETGYLPKRRFSYSPEILEHFDRIVAKWDLGPKSYLQTEITSMVWDEGFGAGTPRLLRETTSFRSS